MLKNHNKKMLQTRKKLLCGLIGATLLWSEASIVCAAEAAETPQSAEEQSVADPKKQSFELDKLIITAEGYHLPPAYAGGQIARGSRVGLLGNMDFLDTPFNTTSYTAATIENQQDQGLAGVLALDPAVRDITGTSYSPTWTIRGLSVGMADVGFNGLYGLIPYTNLGTDLLNGLKFIKG